jgi:hypothetical protein
MTITARIPPPDMITVLLLPPSYDFPQPTRALSLGLSVIIFSLDELFHIGVKK